MQARVTAIKTVRDDIRILHIRPEALFFYRAGQYVEIGFGGMNPRPYSVAGTTDEKDLEIHIKGSGGPASRYVIETLSRGETVTLEGPHGENIYEPGDPRPHLLIGGGLGFAPLKAIIEDAFLAGHNSRIDFFWGSESAEKQYCADLFRTYAETYKNFFFESVIGEPVGNIAAAAFDDLSGHKIYIAGPPAMLAPTITALEEKAARRDNIFFDDHPEAATPLLTESM